jgi:hypothetical protein
MLAQELRAALGTEFASRVPLRMLGGSHTVTEILQLVEASSAGA